MLDATLWVVQCFYLPKVNYWSLPEAGYCCRWTNYLVPYEEKMYMVLHQHLIQLKTNNYLTYSFKINVDCIFDLFSVTGFIFFRIWIFHSSETRWLKSESCLYSLYSFRQATAHFINNKGAPGLWNPSDILSWWFLKKSCWKQSGFVKKGKAGNAFSHSCVGFVYVVCNPLSFVISPWYYSQMVLGRAPTS